MRTHSSTAKKTSSAAKAESGAFDAPIGGSEAAQSEGNPAGYPRWRLAVARRT